MPMNIVEQKIANKYPGLVRIEEKKGPAPISVTIVKNHYPDFKILFPEEQAGLWVEIKGHIVDRMYLPMLANYPDSLKKFYRVVLVNKSKKEREKVGSKLDKLGIVWSSLVIPNQWFLDAAKLWEEQQRCKNGQTLVNLKTTPTS